MQVCAWAEGEKGEVKREANQEMPNESKGLFILEGQSYYYPLHRERTLWIGIKGDFESEELTF